MDGRIYKLKELLLKRLDHHWTVEEMAGMVNLSLPHLHKLFRAETGMPPMNFLNEVRLEKASELLSDTNCFLQIKQIGFRTGLSDTSHFTRYFKKKFGVTPTEYRNCYRHKIQAEELDGEQQ